jgi:hypothetical protein
MRVEHRSANPNHETPDVILDLVRSFAPIKLDPCTTKSNPTGAEYIRTPQCSPDGLETAWHEFDGLVYVNPPYGRRKGQRCLEWVNKAIEEYQQGAEIIMLLPARTDTQWFQRLFRFSVPILWIKGRLTFKGQKSGAPFPSALIYMGGRMGQFAWHALQSGIGEINT